MRSGPDTDTQAQHTTAQESDSATAIGEGHPSCGLDFVAVGRNVSALSERGT